MFKDKISKKYRTIFGSIIFVAIFVFILSMLGYIFVPKWVRGRDSAEMRGFYQEPDNSLDYILLGSCNIFSSYSPTMAYREYGISGYSFSTPDQELAVSYHYLLEALKTQKPKVVVLETLMMMLEPSPNREYYNRFSTDYMPMSLNKAQLILALGSAEVDHMRTLNPSTPDKLLTYAGYFFPAIRYHSRDDITNEDFDFWFDEEQFYSEYKGGFPGYDYFRNYSLDAQSIANGTKIRDFSLKYFNKIKELCEKEGIPLVLTTSPNHHRWDEQRTETLFNFIEQTNLPHVNFFEEGINDQFELWDYSVTTGRLNVYGMRKFTRTMAEYLIENYSLPQHQQEPENKKNWDASYVEMEQIAEERGLPIEYGKLSRLTNEAEGIRIRWNETLDSDSYDIYRSDENTQNFKKIATSKGETYVDNQVVHGKGYTYYVVPTSGELKDVKSDERYYIYLEAPKNFESNSTGTTIDLAWDKVEGIDHYRVDRKLSTSTNFKHLYNAKEEKFEDADVVPNRTYEYWLQSTIVRDEKYYFSAPVLTINQVKK